MKFSLCLIVLFLSVFANAQAANSEWVMANHIKARLVAERGKFGVEMETDPGWHTYYKDPGDAGIPTTFKWDGSKDLKIVEVVFPPPKDFDEYDIKTKAYEGNIFFPVKAEFGAQPHAEVKVEGAICQEVCMAYAMNLVSDLPNLAQQDASKQNLSGSYFFIVITAFLAGLILNFMPCVLPVLSLKVMGVLRQSGVERTRVRLNFAAASLGIIFSFLVLAIVAIILRNAGMAVGWGLHFQSPIFVGILFVITLVFSTSLLGLFHLKPPSWIAGSGENNTAIGNFFSGMLATVLGTSCTAPFVVTAVGFALSGSVADILFIFTMMGIGMASPFILFALRPQIASILPKPGVWMLRVKHVMGVLLLGTAIWLGYILYGQITSDQKAFEEVKISRAVEAGQVVFVNVSADWCFNCKVNEARVINTEEMQAFFKSHKVVIINQDMTRPSKVLMKYLKRHNRYGIPFDIVYGPKAPEGILLPTLLTRHQIEEAVEKAEK